MRISFRFNPEKAVQAIGYILSALGGRTDKAKLTKLLYLADRQSFLDRGVTITGDKLVAMPYGPVPSGCLDLLNGVPIISHDRVFSFIHVDDTQVILREPAPSTLLAPEDRDILNRILTQFGAMGTWRLVRCTHQLPDYGQTYVEDTASTIPFEVIASTAGDERRFRLNRAVISPATAAAMPCPFTPGADATL